MSPSSCQVLSNWAKTDRSREQLRHLQRLASVGDMTGRVAHELNNTLMAVLGWAKRGLQSAQDAEAASKALARVCANAERAIKICQTLKGLCGAQAGAREMVRISQIIAEARGSLDGHLDGQAVTVECSCPDDLAVEGRKVELVQVLLNMMLNSCQAMAEEGGTLRVLAERDSQTRCVSITIADNGPGIRADNIRQVFEPFFSTKQPSDAEGQGGSGLGLAICRDIVISHGGFIEVQSIEGQGASFTIFLPGSEA